MALTNGLVVMTPTSTAKTGTGSTATINSNGSVTFASCATLSLNGVFTSSYDNYMLNIRWSQATNVSFIYSRLRASGTDSTATTDYNHQYISAVGTAISGGRLTGDGFWTVAYSSTTYRNGMSMFLFGPKLSSPTAFRSVAVDSLGGGNIYDVAGTHELSTSYDGITLYPSQNSISGLVTVFGFNQ
jgi:hypothetical protein